MGVGESKNFGFQENEEGKRANVKEQEGKEKEKGKKRTII